MKTTPHSAAKLAGSMLILTLIISACSSAPTPSPTPTTDLGAIYTQAAATLVFEFTQTALARPTATETPVPSDTPTPGPTDTQEPLPSPREPNATDLASIDGLNYPTLTPVPVDPALAHGCYNASFVADVPVWNAPSFEGGVHFTKTWRVKNTGSCDWPRGFLIMFISGSSFGTSTRPIDQKVAAGALADISLDMISPYLNGVVTSNWSLATDIGKPFGPILPVTITLPGALTGTQTPGGCLSSTFVSDASIPNGTKIKAGTNFTKSWVIQNTGTCDWTGAFRMTYVSGDNLGANTFKIHQTVLPNNQVEISIDMTAPTTTGPYTSAWQLASDSGQLFGAIFQFNIVVH